jgi:hypothetical protein
VAKVNSTKFITCVLGIITTLWITLVGKMSGDVTMALAIVIGGYYGGNSYITGKALTNGKHPNGLEK